MHQGHLDVVPFVHCWKGATLEKMQGIVKGESSDSKWKELLPIVIASAVWGPECQGKVVLMYCDNKGEVAMANSAYSKAPQITHSL